MKRDSHENQMENLYKHFKYVKRQLGDAIA